MSDAGLNWRKAKPRWNGWCGDRHPARSDESMQTCGANYLSSRCVGTRKLNG
jgi:hypothetical protein